MESCWWDFSSGPTNSDRTDEDRSSPLLTIGASEWRSHFPVQILQYLTHAQREGPYATLEGNRGRWLYIITGMLPCNDTAITD